jgi:hypothetical protein
VPIATPTLAVTDQGDGTVLADLTGASVGAVNFLYRLQLADTDQEWTNTGPILGSPISLANGIYFFHALSTLGDESAVSNIVCVGVHDGTAALMERLCLAVQSRLVLLDLSGIGSDVIYQEEFEDNNVQPPCVVVVPNSESDASILNNLDDVNYSVRVIFCDRGPKNDATARARHLRWREAVARAFRAQRLPGVPATAADLVQPCEVSYGPVFDRKLPRLEYRGSELILSYRSREVRGLGA